MKHDTSTVSVIINVLGRFSRRERDLYAKCCHSFSVCETFAVEVLFFSLNLGWEKWVDDYVSNLSSMGLVVLLDFLIILFNWRPISVIN